MRTVEQGLANSIIAQSRALHASATRSVLQTGLIVLLVLIVVLMITIVVARSMVRPAAQAADRGPRGGRPAAAGDGAPDERDRW